MHWLLGKRLLNSALALILIAPFCLGQEAAPPPQKTQPAIFVPATPPRPNGYSGLEGGMDDAPLALFESWFAEAAQQEPNDHNAMALATVDAAGQPSVRMVLLKGHGPDGFVFYTNQRSHKGTALAAQPRAALLFHWKSLRRQVRIEGPVSAVTNAEADAYFASRGRDSQIGAWASEQSQTMERREELLERFEAAAARFAR